MKNWTIGKRITVGGGALCLLIVLVGSIAWYFLGGIRKDADRLRVDVMPGTIKSAEFALEQSENFTRTILYGQSTSAEERKRWKTELDATSEKLNKIISEYEASITTEEDRALFNKVIALRATYRNTRSEYLKLADTGKAEDADKFLVTELMSASSNYAGQVRALFDLNAREGDKLSVHINGISTRTTAI